VPGDTIRLDPFVAAAAVLLAYALARGGVHTIKHFAEQRRVLDIPNERSSHTRPTPRGGGLAIVAVTAGLALLANAALGLGSWTQLLPIVAAWLLVAAVSLADDLRSLPNRVRFAAHVIAAAVVILTVGYWDRIALPVIGEVTLGWVGLPLTLLWLVGLTNAYNFMDGIDGIAGSQAVAAGITWGLTGPIIGSASNALIGLVLAGASAGFLAYNWPPARIFMGDVGSAFIGLVLATLAVAGHARDARLALVGLLAVWPFVFDAAFTFLRRAVRRENVFAPHRSHLYQRLVILGHSHRNVTLLYTALAALGSLLAVAWLCETPGASLAIAIVTPLAATGLWAFVRSREQLQILASGNSKS